MFVKNKKKVIITGDFDILSNKMKKICSLNFVTKEKTYLKSKNKYAKEFNDKLDYIFYKGLKVKKKEVIRKNFSDHYGISVDFKE